MCCSSPAAASVCSLQDDLERVRGRTSAASLLLSAASAAAALMLLLAEAEVADMSGCSLLDAVICKQKFYGDV